MVMGSEYVLLLSEKNGVHLVLLKVNFVIFMYINNIHSLVKCDIVVQIHSHYQVTMYTCHFFFAFVIIYYCNIYIYYLWHDWKYIEGDGYGKEYCVEREIITYKRFSEL